MSRKPKVELILVEKGELAIIHPSPKDTAAPWIDYAGMRIPLRDFSLWADSNPTKNHFAELGHDMDDFLYLYWISRSAIMVRTFPEGGKVKFMVIQRGKLLTEDSES